MPNECYGSVTFHTNNSEELNAIFDAIRSNLDGEEILFDFNKIIPLPKDQNGSIIYDRQWCYENWGTNRNCYYEDISDNDISFYTAWSPCSPIVKQLSVMFPDVIFEYHYDNLECCFCGCEVYSAGRVLYRIKLDYSVRWLDNPDDEEEYIEKKTQVLEETAEYQKGKTSICINSDGRIYQMDGEFIDCGIEEFGIDPYDYIIYDVI